MTNIDTCPNCNNSNVSYEFYDFDGTRCMVRFMCDSCKHTWEQEYKMQAVD